MEVKLDNAILHISSLLDCLGMSLLIACGAEPVGGAVWEKVGLILG